MPVGRRRRASRAAPRGTGRARRDLRRLPTRLEQGRATAPSAQVVEALAQALRLADPERELLYRLAGHAVPGPGRRAVADHAERAAAARPAGAHPGRRLRRQLDARAGQRALRRADGRDDHLARHRTQRRLAQPAGLPQPHRAHRAGAGRTRGPARRRPAPDRLPLPGRPARCGRLSPSSRPAARASPSSGTPTAPRRRPTCRGRRSSTTPRSAAITLDCDTLIVAVDDLRIMVYTAEPGTEDAERLALAVVLGTQQLDQLLS